MSYILINVRCISHDSQFYNFLKKYPTQDICYMFYNLYSQYYPSPILAFKQFNENNCGIFYDILYFLNLPEQPSNNLLNKINSIISESVWIKLI